MKKKSAKGKPSGKRTLKDLPARKRQDVKGDLSADSAAAVKGGAVIATDFRKAGKGQLEY